MKFYLAAGVTAAFLTGCGGSSSSDESSSVSAKTVAETAANIAYASYSDSLATAKELEKAVDAFVATPTEANLSNARKVWFKSREPYGQTEVFRFDDGIVDEWEGKVNAWPLDESLIDYVANEVDGLAGDISPGIIQDTVGIPEITGAVLRANFEKDGEEANVSTGYHAIEFLLWGQDLNEDGSGSGPRDTSAGQRPVSDYDTGAGCTSGKGNLVDSSICKRRGQYLKIAADLLVEDLQEMVNNWKPGVAGNHYATFVAGGDNSVKQILASMGRLSYGELAGERINIALLKNSQEDEHSCFSDNTHRDIVTNALGIQNMFLGTYGSVKGDGIEAYLRDKGQDQLADKLKANLADTVAKAGVLSSTAEAGVPFDNQIQGTEAQKNAVAAVIDALTKQATRDANGSILAASKALGLSLTKTDLEQDTEENL